jgi:predicted RNA-binding Zn-ribbon protein involved in translation (DUF1610 family)
MSELVIDTETILLMPCPFCGEVEGLEDMASGSTAWVTCNSCGCDGPSADPECLFPDCLPVEQRARIQWNMRVKEETK